jgi:serine phosphatase RsbU (regulator of sigma subunit)
VIISVTGSEAQRRLFLGVLVLGLTVIAYEFLMLTVVQRHIRIQVDLPTWVWGLNLFIETLSPTLLLVLLTENSFLGPYRSLVAPAGLLYFFFIILSTLRLSPALCWLTGSFSCAGYLFLVLYTLTRYPVSDYEHVVFPLQEYLIYALIILVGGFVAGIVAGQIRKYVFAALQEAEAERRIQLFEREYDIARSIQQGLLPSASPETSTFEVVGWNQPAHKTGGDFYDWQLQPNGDLLVVLADVCGHGIGPALVATACRAYMRACFQSHRDLGNTLSYVNELLIQELPADRFITLVAGLLDLQNSKATILSAGHGPIILWSAGKGDLSSFLANEVPLGVSSNANYDKSFIIKMEVGDILILLTDGFFEWKNQDGEEYGLNRLYSSIRSAADLSAQNLISKLYENVMEYTEGTGQEDDVTIVAIKKVA